MAYLTLFLLACPYGIIKQKFRFWFKKGSSKKFPNERRDYESVDEKSLSEAMTRKNYEKKNSGSKWLKSGVEMFL